MSNREEIETDMGVSDLCSDPNYEHVPVKLAPKYASPPAPGMQVHARIVPDGACVVVWTGGGHPVFYNANGQAIES